MNVFVHSSDFFSWNKVKIRYCDGASFAGRPESEFKVSWLFGLGKLFVVSNFVILLSLELWVTICAIEWNKSFL